MASVVAQLRKETIVPMAAEWILTAALYKVGFNRRRVRVVAAKLRIRCNCCGYERGDDHY